MSDSVYAFLPFFIKGYYIKSDTRSRLTVVGLVRASVLCCCIVAGQVYGQAPEIAKPSDVRMVIDISGSMKKNDPQNLRRPALEMLVQLLPEGSKAGIWSFGQYVNMLVPHGKVDKRWSKKATAASAEINSIAQFTNIGEALEKAAYDFTTKNSQYQRHVILLTDGMVDINRNNAINKNERERIINKILPMYEQAGITLHTIALSDNADKQLLNKLALATDGKAEVAKTAEELMDVFLQVFDQAVPSEGVPFDGESFIVDSSIEEFTALIFRKPNAKDTQIISPDKQTYTKDANDPHVNWYHTDKYDLITISQPFEGEWKVSADLEPQSRVTVVSDLSIAVRSMPTNIALDDTINASLVLREDNKTITRAEFLSLLTIDVAVTSKNGKAWSQRLSDGDVSKGGASKGSLSKKSVPANGLYSVLLEQFDKEGQYKINFTVDGKSFKRRYSHQLSVRTPFLVEVKKSKNEANNQFLIQVIPQSTSIDVANTQVVGELTYPSGKNEPLPFTLTEDGTWGLSVITDKEGEYSLSIQVVTEGQAPDISLETVVLSQGEEDNIFAVADTPKKPEEKAEEKTVPAVEAEAVAEEDIPADDVDEDVMGEADIKQLMLYGIIAVVNLLIVVLAYIIYRKLFKKKAADKDGDEDEDGEEDRFSEPPMDEMVVEEIEENDDVDMDEEEVAPVETPEPEPKPVDDNVDEELDLDQDENEEVPDFSLDDFSPDALEGEDPADPKKD
ncbi:MAG: hypothetical protein ACI9NY_000668 [Kiritimatiellia bacterium]|jgi:uncharacterized protein (TIGR03503 family)